MNNSMKFVSTLSLLLATSASAQVVSILPGANGVYNAPLFVPGVKNEVVISPLIMPAPTLNASVALTLSPALIAPMIPVMPIMPATPAKRAVHVLPIMPVVSAPNGNYLPVMPVTKSQNISFAIMRAHLIAAAKDVKTIETPAPSVEKLDNLFDGKTTEKTDDETGPVRNDRHHSLPENDLEKEIGAY